MDRQSVQHRAEGVILPDKISYLRGIARERIRFSHHTGVGAGETAGRNSFLASATAFALGIGQRVPLGAHDLETETRLAVRTIVR